MCLVLANQPQPLDQAKLGTAALHYIARATVIDPESIIALELNQLSEQLRKKFCAISDDSISNISKRTNISRPWLTKFSRGGDVCMNILNRLANYFTVNYVLTNNLVANDYDAEGIDQLIRHLRHLLASHSMREVAKHVPISRSRLGDFKNGDIIMYALYARARQLFQSQLHRRTD